MKKNKKKERNWTDLLLHVEEFKWLAMENIFFLCENI